MPIRDPLEPAFWVEESLTWGRNSEFDKEVEDWIKNVNLKIEAKLKAIDGSDSYLYLNDVDKGQGFFESYGKKSVDRLKKIRAKYDPDRVFTNLIPGDWKIDHAGS